MANTTKWVATNAAGDTPRGITVNGQPFFAKGVCYSPVPWGGSANWKPYGDFFYEPWNAIWARDLPLMRAAGINMVRTYNLQMMADDERHDHTPFLDACWNDGVDPVYVLVGCGACSDMKIYDPWTGNQAHRDAAKAALVDLAESYATHPAVMGFIVGNEVNNDNTRRNVEFWKWIEVLAAAAKAAAPDKLTTMSTVDDGLITITNGDPHVPHLDFWGFNNYQGNLSSPAANTFGGAWPNFARASKKPLMLTEWGAPASTHDAQNNLLFTPELAADMDRYVDGHYRDIAFNAVSTTSNGGDDNPNAANWAPVCVGSCYFEWTDEWWKADADYPRGAQIVQNPGRAGDPNNPNDPGKRNAAFPGGWDDEECFGLNAIEPAGPDPMSRPGPPNQDPSYPGPWNFAANEPYPPDILHPRSTLTTLAKLWKA